MAFKMKFSGFKSVKSDIISSYAYKGEGFEKEEDGDGNDKKANRADRRTKRKVKKELKKRGVTDLNPAGN